MHPEASVLNLVGKFTTKENAEIPSLKIYVRANNLLNIRTSHAIKIPN